MHRLRNTLALSLLALTLGLAACSDEEESEPAGGAATATETQAEDTATAPEDTDTAERTETADRPGDGDGGGATAPSGGSPEDQPGGAGDEVPASSQALISGRDGGFHPTVVHVPPFIAIRVELRSEDGAVYELRARGRSVRAGGDVDADSALFQGLRPGERLVLRGDRGRVVVKPDAEPGP